MVGAVAVVDGVLEYEQAAIAAAVRRSAEDEGTIPALLASRGPSTFNGLAAASVKDEPIMRNLEHALAGEGHDVALAIIAPDVIEALCRRNWCRLHGKA